MDRDTGKRLMKAILALCILSLLIGAALGYGGAYLVIDYNQTKNQQLIPDSKADSYTYPKLYGHIVRYKEGSVFVGGITRKVYEVKYDCMKCGGVECKPFELVNKPIKNVKPIYLLWRFEHGKSEAEYVTYEDNEKDLDIEKWYQQQEDKENKVVNRYGVGIYYPKPINMSQLKDK